MKNADIHNSFQDFYHEHADSLFRFCMTKVRDRHIAVDLVQESFINLWDYICKQGALGAVSYPKALLYRIARNAIIDWSRKKKAASLDMLVEAGIDFSHTTNLNEEHMTQDDLQTLLHIIETLAEPYRDALIMRYIDGLSVSEIAEITGETTNLISVRIHRALEKLRSEIGQRIES